MSLVINCIKFFPLCKVIIMPMREDIARIFRCSKHLIFFVSSKKKKKTFWRGKGWNKENVEHFHCNVDIFTFYKALYLHIIKQNFVHHTFFFQLCENTCSNSMFIKEGNSKSLKLKNSIKVKKKGNKRSCTLLVCCVISCGRSLIAIDKMTETTCIIFLEYLYTKVIRDLELH